MKYSPCNCVTGSFWLDFTDAKLRVLGSSLCSLDYISCPNSFCWLSGGRLAFPLAADLNLTVFFNLVDPRLYQKKSSFRYEWHDLSKKEEEKICHHFTIILPLFCMKFLHSAITTAVICNRFWRLAELRNHSNQLLSTCVFERRQEELILCFFVNEIALHTIFCVGVLSSGC